MLYLPLAALTWALVPRLLQRDRLPELSVYGLLAAVLATLQDRLVLLYRLWEYRDSGPVNTHTEIAFLISISAAPIFAMRFAQHLKPDAPPPWRRIAKYTTVAMLPELVGLFTGHIAYHQWWNAGWSVLAYLPIWLGIWAFHRWLNRPDSGLGPPCSRSVEESLLD